MLLNDYHPHHIPIAKELIRIDRNSNAAYKETLKQKRELEKKAEKGQRLAGVEEEITQLNSKQIIPLGSYKGVSSCGDRQICL